MEDDGWSLPRKGKLKLSFEEKKKVTSQDSGNCRWREESGRRLVTQ